MDSERKPIITVGPADYGTAIMSVRSEKHDIKAVVLDDACIVDCGYRIWNVVFCKNRVFLITFHNMILNIHNCVRFVRTICHTNYDHIAAISDFLV